MCVCATVRVCVCVSVCVYVCCPQTIRAADLEHMPYLEAVYSETLRLAAPLSSTGRTLHKDLTFSNGVK